MSACMGKITVRLAKHEDCHDGCRLFFFPLMHAALISRSNLANPTMCIYDLRSLNYKDIAN